MSEKLIPVTSESELRVGMIVVLKSCKPPCRRSCGLTHRVMLIKKGKRDMWQTASPLSGHGKSTTVTTTRAIAQGRLFRVDDGIDDEADEQQRKWDEVFARVTARAAENAR